MYLKSAPAFLLFCLATTAYAGDVEIVMVSLSKRGDSWDIETTLRHDDRGWNHYADAWRVVTADGHVLGTRTLYHPHVDEQPFTRSLRDVVIPPATTVVVIEAHDKVHGWSSQRVRVDLTEQKGERYRVNP